MKKVKTKVIDHLGNTYNSEQEMCERYHISKSIFYLRYHKYNWTLEKALTTPMREHRQKQMRMDVNKNGFDTDKPFCVTGEYPSVEYVRYLRYKLAKEENKQKEHSIQREIDKILTERYLFSVMDMVYLKKYKALKKSCPTEIIFRCVGQLKDPQGIAKKIYKNFAPRMLELKSKQNIKVAK